MTSRNWVLTNVDTGAYVESLALTGAELGLKDAPDLRVTKRRLHGGRSDGVDVVEVDNGALSFVVVPTRGMGIWRGSYRGAYLGWQSPVKGPVHPAFVNSLELGGIGWLAGFDEWIVRCGLNSNGPPGLDVWDEEGVIRETPLGLHGRIANCPAHFVELRIDLDPPHEITIVGVVDESMLFFPQLRLTTAIRTTPGSNRLVIDDRVTNQQGTPAELELLYHCNFGRPFLAEGGRFAAPIRTAVPRDAAAQRHVDHLFDYPAPTPGVAEQVYYLDLLTEPAGDRTLAVLVNGAADKACAVRFSKAQLPWFALWKNPAAERDGYVTGLEPGINLPNPKSFERANGRVVRLPVGGSYDAQVVIEVADDAGGVRMLLAEVDRLQVQGPPTILRAPQQPYSNV